MKLGEVLSSISSIDSLQSGNPLLNNKDLGQEGQTFGELLNKSLQQVNESQLQGYNAMEEIATGRVENLSQAVQKIEEAELTLKLALEVKNKALNAYKEVMRMQI
jgi:flagellar hook-basal body complex protein FliE